jgi:hypothetical protein
MAVDSYQHIKTSPYRTIRIGAKEDFNLMDSICEAIDLATRLDTKIELSFNSIGLKVSKESDPQEIFSLYNKLY